MKMYFNQIMENISNSGFLNSEDVIKHELITYSAETIAEEFNRNGLTKSQLRAFFAEIKVLNSRLDDNEKNWNNSVYPMLLMVKSKIVYRANKGSEKSKLNGLENFLLSSINYIQENNSKNGYKNFKAFTLVFEAVVGYSYNTLKD